MGSIMPFRMTYTRVGSSENWAGWQIAGQTMDTPRSMLDEFERLSDNNAGNAALLFDCTEAREIYEWICKWDGSKGENVFFTKLRFGMMDDAGARPSMRADSVAVSLNECPDFFQEPQILLFIDKLCFENRLNIDSKRDDIGKLMAGRTQPDDAYTVFERHEYSSSSDMDMDRIVNMFFDTREAYLTLVRCVYWSLTFKSASTVFVVSDLDNDEKLCVFSLLLRSLIGVYRPKLSMRTLDLPQSRPTTIAFCRSIPPGEKYCVLATGDNNILNDIVLKRLEKHSFVRNLRGFNSCAQISDYYIKLDKSLEKMGKKSAADIGTMEIAEFFSKADIVHDEAHFDPKEIKKVLYRLLNVKHRNELIDTYTVQLMKTVIGTGVHVNGETLDLLWNTAISFDNHELYLLALRYYAQWLIQTEKDDPLQAYQRLNEIRDKNEGYKEFRDEIISITNGGLFLDRFYGEYLGKLEEKTEDELRGYCREVMNLPVKTIINNHISAEIYERGKRILYELMLGRDSAVDRFRDYMIRSSDMISNKITVDDLPKKIIERFWEDFDFICYRYYLHNQYDLIQPKKDYSNNFNVCSRITDCFLNAFKLEVQTVLKLKNLIGKQIYKISEKARENIANEFFDLCCARCDKKKGIDFWCEAAQLKGGFAAEHLLKNNITLFCDPKLFSKEITKSKKFCEEGFCREYLKGMDRYAENVRSREIVHNINIMKKDITKKTKKLN